LLPEEGRSSGRVNINRSSACTHTKHDKIYAQRYIYYYYCGVNRARHIGATHTHTHTHTHTIAKITRIAHTLVPKIIAPPTGLMGAPTPHPLVIYAPPQRCCFDEVARQPTRTTHITHYYRLYSFLYIYTHTHTNINCFSR
jgi:hypothetical protein